MHKRIAQCNLFDDAAYGMNADQRNRQRNEMTALKESFRKAALSWGIESLECTPLVRRIVDKRRG